MNLALIGYRGTGKTTVGRGLAARLGWAFVDGDDEIESKAGRTIAAIFAQGGEPAFRDIEAAVIAELAERDQTVLALGGGAVLRPENRSVIGGLGVVVWLQADPQTIQQRTAADATTGQRRPNLTIKGGLAEIEELLAIRSPIYDDCADLTIGTAGKQPDDIITEILEHVRERMKAEG